MVGEMPMGEVSRVLVLKRNDKVCDNRLRKDNILDQEIDAIREDTSLLVQHSMVPKQRRARAL